MSRPSISHCANFTCPDGHMWNINTIGSDECTSFIQKNEKLQQDDLAKTTDFNYGFVTFHDLYNLQDYANWGNRQFQTIGVVRCKDGRCNLYPLSHGSDTCVKLKMPLNLSEACSEMYARLYGFCLFYASEEKILPIYPKDLEAKPYMEITINSWVNLGNLQHAQRLEQILYKVNYCKNYI